MFPHRAKQQTVCNGNRKSESNCYFKTFDKTF